MASSPSAHPHWTTRDRLALTACFLLLTAFAPAQPRAQPATQPPTQYGPYSGVFLPDGLGLSKPLAASDPLLAAATPWTIACWINLPEPIASPELVAGLGSISGPSPRYLRIEPDRLSLWTGAANPISGVADLTPNRWHLLAASFDGHTVSLYSDGKLAASGAISLAAANPLLWMAPHFQTPDLTHFGGRIAAFTLTRRALTAAELATLYQAPPDFAAINFEEGSKSWAIQTRGQAGYRAPQEPATLPHQRGSFSSPVAIERPPAGKSLTQLDPNDWAFSDGWTLLEAPKVDADGAHLSKPDYTATGWMRATVPGTVLTTMVDDGIYPDPYYGLNNLAIPESLNRQDYWYRNVFDLPTSVTPASQRVELDLEGINYKAFVWLNGSLVGSVAGAFQRGQFDITPLLKPGRNALAIRISPPPHPGIPQEQSILGGPGENGGLMEIDGPTFLATEGWDWIPAIRDRDSGLWQPVLLRVTHRLKLGDTQVVTSFPKHDTSSARIDISVPVVNPTKLPVQAVVHATLEKLALRKLVTLQPGETIVRFTPEEFPSLVMQAPRLWWPNGYGKPELYHLQVSVAEGLVTSDAKDVRFGIREISYELSLLDPTGHLRRVEYFPTEASKSSGPIVDVSHDGMREVPSPDPVALTVPEANRDRYHMWVSTLTKAADTSPAIEPSSDSSTAPYLVIKVNGVRIAARGGNWGMDDARKRVSRERLEPFFRLNRDAGLNTIRNWVGQSTEQTFYDLADEYGMLIWNDFWESTENYNIEAQDPALFLANVADTIRHFRNHPSIAVWCGRNEGVPQPIINTGIDDLVRTLDGTRYYSPSSNALNLAGSGPYRYQVPAQYFTTLNRGFSVETGTPSMSTLESFESTTPKADQWPIDDVWAYHDWHASGNGVVGPFMDEIEAEFGAPTSLEDFERKAQMLNYVDHRAIFEGMDANLWSPNSGRLLWMTQPAWPSTMWQILSSDYDTQASYYGVKKACEPLHVQLNLATNEVQIVNTTTSPAKGLTASVQIFALNNTLLAQASTSKDVDADAVISAMRLDLAQPMARGIAIIALVLKDTQGATVSQNLYWLGGTSASYRELNNLPPTAMKLTASSTSSTAATAASTAAAPTASTAVTTIKVAIQLTNAGTSVSLANKLTLLTAADHARILPAYFSDNYISLLPGESRTITLEYPATAKAPAELTLRGWNAIPQTIPIPPPN